ncbi:MAG: MEDS domain-containing protein [Desulfarculus sp.]|nr:MEDS domain-containing protein [Desulfarculus sp.]
MFKQHDHVGFVCGQLWQWRKVVFPYLAQGLARGERCAYLTTLHTPWLLTNLLAWQGVNLQAVKARGQLVIADAARHYLHRGWFDPDRAIAKNIAATRRALDQGFTGLRSVGDMSWAAYHPLEWERLEEYETRLDRELFACLPATAICLYDQQLFSPGLREMVERTHPLMIDALGLPRPGGRAAGHC